MALPDFVGIGAQRAGSTWLHELLAAHSRIYMPTRRKEVHYFDLYHNRGRGWYESFFREARPGQVVGEVTPDYLHTPGCAERVAASLPDAKLVVILRDPVERAYSHYKKLVKDDNYRGSFGDVLMERPDLTERGFYAAQLSEYLRHFGRDRFYLLVYEDAVRDVERTKTTLARFLGLEPQGFSAEAGEGVVHPSYVPRARAAYALSKTLARKLHAADLDWLVNAAKRVRADRLFGHKAAKQVAEQTTERETEQAATADVKRALRKTYLEDVAALERMFGLELGVLRHP